MATMTPARKTARNTAATTVPANTPTDVKITRDTVEELAGRYVSVQNTLDKLDGTKKWEWARDVALLLESTADKSARTAASEKLGELIGIGLGRAAYSGSWIRQHCSAYKKFVNGLTDQDDYRGFLAAVNGNAGPSHSTEARAARSVSTSTDSHVETDSDGEVASDFLGKITAAVKRAIAAGISLAEINEAVLKGQE